MVLWGSAGQVTRLGHIRTSSLSPQIQVIEDDRAKTTEPFATGVRGQAPPLVTTQFHVKDQGGLRSR